MKKARWYVVGGAVAALGLGATLAAPSAQAAEPQLISTCVHLIQPNALVIIGMDGPLGGPLGAALGLPTNCEG